MRSQGELGFGGDGDVKSGAGLKATDKDKRQNAKTKCKNKKQKRHSREWRSRGGPKDCASLLVAKRRGVQPRFRVAFAEGFLPPRRTRNDRLQKAGRMAERQKRSQRRQSGDWRSQGRQKIARAFVDEYTMTDGRRRYLLGDGGWSLVYGAWVAGRRGRVVVCGVVDCGVIAAVAPVDFGD
jgi:hypothetical protein